MGVLIRLDQAAERFDPRVQASDLQDLYDAIDSKADGSAVIQRIERRSCRVRVCGAA